MSDPGPLRRRLAENLKLLLLRQSWSQDDLAQKAGISQKTVSDMCRAGHDPRLTQVEKAALALGHPAWAILAVDLSVHPAPRPSELLEIIELYTAASPGNRAAIRSVAEAVAGKQAQPA